ncbi:MULTISPECIES: spore germination protein [Paenibacillus]|uniref:spore germination protein n=1 Tax=Paenibacillus TaxID=44249 RepID=UPI000BA77D52|nr:spore germination protein [Paenibacillus sp. 7523-1]MBM6387754.1 spore germination protein [Paenibacillus sp.]PAD32180.1 spore germination protein [Paenibacillus sp. 7523-1]
MSEPSGTIPKDDSITPSLNESTARIQEIFTNTPDLIIRKLYIKQTGEQAAIIYMDEMTDKTILNHDVLAPLQLESGNPSEDFITTVGYVKPYSKWEDLKRSIMIGYSVLFIEGRSDAYVLDTKGIPQRAIEDPQQEPSLKGAHQGFIENGSQNVALIRRYIADKELKLKRYIVGTRGQTAVSLLYLEDVVDPEVVKVLEERIQSIDVDAIINTGELVEFIEDQPLALLPQIITTERPDAAASQILQGRCVVVVDGSPSVVVAPVTFMSFFQTVDDYSSRWSISSFLRSLRIFAFFVAIFLPGFFISVISFHYEIIPMKLLLTLGESRGQVPFPPFVEAIIMELTLEMLREAGVRLPAPIGQTVGIVGGIVIGQAVVQAGLISNVMVIVVAFTAISSFIIPNQDMAAAVRLMRFMMMVFATWFGFIGLVVGMMTIIGRLITLNSLNTSYSTPIAPFRPVDWKDTLLRLPLWMMNTRPISTRSRQTRRQGNSREWKEKN